MRSWIGSAKGCLVETGRTYVEEEFDDNKVLICEHPPTRRSMAVGAGTTQLQGRVVLAAAHHAAEGGIQVQRIQVKASA